MQLVVIKAYKPVEIPILIETLDPRDAIAQGENKLSELLGSGAIVKGELGTPETIEIEKEEPCVGMEYHESYFRGATKENEWVDNLAELKTVYIPIKLVEKLGADNAFKVWTGVDPIHIYSEDIGETYRLDGTEIS